MEQDKVKVIEDWPTLKDASEVYSFLSLARYYHYFIQQLAHIVASLTNLLKKSALFEWNLEQQSTFDRLKEALIIILILQWYDSNLLCILDIDTFDFAIRAVLQ